LADCDVDAADLHLILEPDVRETHEFSGGKRAAVLAEKCTSCGRCAEVCRFDAVIVDPPAQPPGQPRYRIDPIACEGCGVCAWFCPAEAVNFARAVNGEWYLSETRHGPMVHAKLGIAEENSGKLVTTVRTRARQIAAEQNRPLVLIDGSPGIGCPVVASITGAEAALIVTEPTRSGLHDLLRVAEVAGHFDIPAMVCINKADLNPELADEIEDRAGQVGLAPAGRVRYDRAVTDAQLARRAVVEVARDGCAADIRAVWDRLSSSLL
jgi:MinD superfamily P-loop ATPase